MRLQHLTRVAGGLSPDSPERSTAKAVIVEEVERLRWRLWNGKARDAGISIDRIRAVMHHFRDEADGRHSVAPSRKLWTALRALDDYLTGQSDRLVNYGERRRAGRRVGTALTEGTANFLVNRRMAKSQQWLIPLVPAHPHLVGGGLEGEAQAEQTVEGGGGRAPAVEPEHELVEVGLEVRRPQPVVDAQRPPLRVREHPVHPGQDQVGRRVAAHPRVVLDVPEPLVARPAVAHHGAALGHVAGDEGAER